MLPGNRELNGLPRELNPDLIQTVIEWEREKANDSGWLVIGRGNYWKHDNPQLLFWVEFADKNELWIAAREDAGSEEGSLCKVSLKLQESTNRVDHGLTNCIPVHRFPPIYKMLIQVYGKQNDPKQINLDDVVFH